MSLLEQPEVLIDLVLETLVRDNVGEALSARGVNKIFKRKIEHELITKTPISEFGSRPLFSKNPARAYIEKEENAMAFLSYRMTNRPGRPDSGKYIPAFLNKIIDKLMEFVTPSCNSSAVRARYQDHLVRVLASKLYKFETGYTWSSDINDTDTTMFNQHASMFMGDKELDVEDLAAASAAVGNIRALKTFVNAPEVMLRSGIFQDLWTAATLCGQIESIRYLLKQLESSIPFFRANSGNSHREHPWIPREMCRAFRVSIKRHMFEITEVLGSFLIKHGYFGAGNYDETLDAVYFPMRYGSTKAFLFLHDQIPDVERLGNYEYQLRDGFAMACKEGHAELIKAVLKSQYAPSIRHVADEFVVWKNGNHWDFYEVEDPVLMAALHSRVSVLEVQFEHDPTLIEYESLLEFSVLGFRPRTYSKFQRGRWEDNQKHGSRYATLQCLIDHGLHMGKNTIKVTNYFAKYILAQEKLSGDLAMCLILLLVTLKSRIDPVSLRKQLHVPVKKALHKILEIQPEMRAVGPVRFDFYGLAQELGAWLNCHA